MCLNDLFTDIADAIRTKKGTTDKIIASNFPDEIASIEGGGSVEIEGVKIFSTTEEMNNTTADISDLAIVYKEEISYRHVEVGDTISPLNLVNHITLPEAITEETTYTINTKIGNALLNAPGTGTVTINPTSAKLTFHVGGQLNTEITEIHYTSTDGIHYTNNLRGQLYKVRHLDLNYYGKNTLGVVQNYDGYANYFFAMDVVQNNTFEGVYEYIDFYWESVETQLDASSEHIVEGKTAYSDGIIEGSLKDNGTLNYVPSNEEQTIPEGYTSGGIVQGDNNLVAENIRAGVSVFGVTGTHEGMTLQINSIEGVSVEGTTLVMEVNNG